MKIKFEYHYSVVSQGDPCRGVVKLAIDESFNGCGLVQVRDDSFSVSGGGWDPVVSSLTKWAAQREAALIEAWKKFNTLKATMPKGNTLVVVIQ